MLNYDPQRIALIKPSALGDIVHSLPVLRALRRRFPRSHIAWVVNRRYEPLLRGHPDLDAIIPFDRSAAPQGCFCGSLRFARFLQQLRRQRFDLVIDLQGLLRTGLMTSRQRGPRRIGLASAREGARLVLHALGRRSRPASHSRRRSLLARRRGARRAPARQGRFTCRSTPRRSAWARALLHECPRPWLAVGVGSRWLTKRWPPGAFRRAGPAALRPSSAARRSSSARRTRRTLAAAGGRARFAARPARPDRQDDPAAARRRSWPRRT